MTPLRNLREIANLVIAAAAAIGAIASPGCVEDKLESRWCDRTITIDGKAPEWAGREAYYDEDEGLKVGFCNDAKYLYVFLSTWHRQTEMQALAGGLTLWIDPAGGTKQIFGVAYPVGGAARREGESFPPSEGQTPPSQESPAPTGGAGFPGSQGAGADPARLARLLEAARGEIQIVGTGSEPLLTIAAADSGSSDIDAMIDIVNRTLIYELRIPLAAEGGAPYAVKAGPGATIGIGIQTGEMAMHGMRPEGQRPPGGGGSPGSTGEGAGGPPGGGMGGYGGGMGGPGGRPGGTASEPLKLWFKVKLASGPAETVAK